MSRWIPITESLPDDGMTVLAALDPTFHDEPVWLGYLDADTWREADGRQAFVTHWQHLPEPPAHGVAAAPAPDQCPNCNPDHFCTRPKCNAPGVQEVPR